MFGNYHVFLINLNFFKKIILFLYVLNHVDTIILKINFKKLKKYHKQPTLPNMQDLDFGTINWRVYLPYFSTHGTHEQIESLQKRKME